MLLRQRKVYLENKALKMALEIIRTDDFIEYFLFPQLDGVLEENEVEALNVISQKINEIAQSYVSNYIWHKDPFILKTRSRTTHLLSSIDNNGKFT